MSLRQWEGLGDAGYIDPRSPARRELTVDLRLHNSLDQDVASQSDVERSDVGRGREQRGRCLGRLAEQVIDAPLHALDQSTHVPIVRRKSGGFVEERLCSAMRHGGLHGRQRIAARRPPIRRSHWWPRPGATLAAPGHGSGWSRWQAPRGHAGVPKGTPRNTPPNAPADGGNGQMCQWSPADGPRQQSLLRVISEVLAGPPQEPRLTGSVGGRGQEEGLGVRWQGANLLQVSQLELPADWQRV